jgi:teichuronic acid biosynthesis glycosyltransferase TuaG
MNPPVFTVIMATYNRQKLLPRAIDSVLKQTFGDFELIVVDNGSTDGTKSFVEGIKDPRVRYVLNPNPTGSCDRPRNIGIRSAKGELISFLDDDDIWYPDRLEKVKQAFCEHPDISCICHYENRRVDGKVDGVLRHGPWTEDLYDRLLYEGNCMSSCATTVKLGTLRRFNGFDEQEKYSEVADYDLWIRMARSSLKVFFLQEALGEFSLTGTNWSVVSPRFALKQANMVKDHIMEREGKPLFYVSAKGLYRLFQLYCIAGRSFFAKRYYAEALQYFGLAALFVLRKPVLTVNLLAKIKERITDA